MVKRKNFSHLSTKLLECFLREKRKGKVKWHQKKKLKLRTKLSDQPDRNGLCFSLDSRSVGEIFAQLRFKTF